MLWIDYREKLGIGFSDVEKLGLLKAKIKNSLLAIKNKISYNNSSFFKFCMMTGMPYYESFLPIDDIIAKLLDDEISIQEFFSIYIAFVNTFEENDYSNFGTRKNLIGLLTTMMEQSKIEYEIQYDSENNEYFIFPRGASELDDALVSATLDWLCDYPIAHKTFINALKQYSSGEYLRDVADNFRKALESFLQEFFNNSNNLDNNINTTGRYLKEQGAEKEITDVLVKLMDLYKKLNDKIAKHNDKVDPKFLEFLMYQTGLFIRMLIVVKKAEHHEAKSHQVDKLIAE